MRNIGLITAIALGSLALAGCNDDDAKPQPLTYNPVPDCKNCGTSIGGNGTSDTNASGAPTIIANVVWIPNDPRIELVVWATSNNGTVQVAPNKKLDIWSNDRDIAICTNFAGRLNQLWVNGGRVVPWENIDKTPLCTRHEKSCSTNALINAFGDSSDGIKAASVDVHGCLNASCSGILDPERLWPEDLNMSVSTTYVVRDERTITASARQLACATLRL